MLFGFFYFDWTMLIVLPAIIFTLWAQMRVKSTFAKYSKIAARSGLTAAEAARRMLDANGLYHVAINRVRGELSDHFDPRTNALYLSDSVHDSRSTASIGVACHEAGHALQHAEQYAPLSFRISIIPVCNITSRLAMPLFIIGLFSTAGYQAAQGMDLGAYLMLAGIACFSFATLFQLVTLPVEFNASARALAEIRNHHILSEEESDGAKKVLTAAAMTYVAALATSLLSLLRLIVIARGSRRD